MSSVDELASKYSSQLGQLKSIFPSWDESDLAFAVQDAKGNIEEAAMAISEGMLNDVTAWLLFRHEPSLTYFTCLSRYLV